MIPEEFDIDHKVVIEDGTQDFLLKLTLAAGFSLIIFGLVK